MPNNQLCYKYILIVGAVFWVFTTGTPRCLADAPKLFLVPRLHHCNPASRRALVGRPKGSLGSDLEEHSTDKRTPKDDMHTCPCTRLSLSFGRVMVYLSLSLSLYQAWGLGAGRTPSPRLWSISLSLSTVPIHLSIGLRSFWSAAACSDPNLTQSDSGLLFPLPLLACGMSSPPGPLDSESWAASSSTLLRRSHGRPTLVRKLPVATLCL